MRRGERAVLLAVLRVEMEAGRREEGGLKIRSKRQGWGASRL
jgi:hypothetical protein